MGVALMSGTWLSSGTWPAYMAELNRALQSVDEAALDSAETALRWAQTSGKRVWIVGNGGSATTANHFACDLSKNTRPKLRAMCLSGLATMTAYANDEGYERVFSEQLSTYGEPNDILVAISTSGKSPNIVAACVTAIDKQMQIVGLTAFGGGPVRTLADVWLHAETNIIEVAEDVHMSLCHELTRRLRQ